MACVGRNEVHVATRERDKVRNSSSLTVSSSPALKIVSNGTSTRSPSDGHYAMGVESAYARSISPIVHAVRPQHHVGSATPQCGRRSSLSPDGRLPKRRVSEVPPLAVQRKYFPTSPLAPAANAPRSAAAGFGSVNIQPATQRTVRRASRSPSTARRALVSPASSSALASGELRSPLNSPAVAFREINSPLSSPAVAFRDINSPLSSPAVACRDINPPLSSPAVASREQRSPATTSRQVIVPRELQHRSPMPLKMSTSLSSARDAEQVANRIHSSLAPKEISAQNHIDGVQKMQTYSKVASSDQEFNTACVAGARVEFQESSHQQHGHFERTAVADAIRVLPKEFSDIEGQDFKDAIRFNCEVELHALAKVIDERRALAKVIDGLARPVIEEPVKPSACNTQLTHGLSANYTPSSSSTGSPPPSSAGSRTSSHSTPSWTSSDFSPREVPLSYRLSMDATK